MCGNQLPNYHTRKEMKKLIDRINWMGLSCHDRALALGCEELKKNSTLFFLLFKYSGRNYLLRNYYLDIGDDDYYRYLSEHMGIEIELKVKKRKYLQEVLTTPYSNDKRIVMVTNSINEVESKMYRIENHPHFILLHNYLEDKQSMAILDEDYSKQYWKAKNSNNGVKYIEKEMLLSELMNRCSNVNCFSKFATNENICAYYVLKKSNSRQYTIEQIIVYFYEQIKECITRIEDIKQVSINEFNKFIEHINIVKETIISDINKKIEMNAEFEITEVQDVILMYKSFSSWFSYPYESKIVQAHHYFIYSVYVALKQLEKCSLTTEKKMQELLKRYNNLKMNITRAIFLKEEEICDWCAKEFEVLIDLEYRIMIELYGYRGEM